MPGVSLQQIVNALIKWKGNVQAAAEDLGVRRNSLYERIERAQLDLQAFREAGASATPFPGMSGVSGMSGSVRQALSGGDRGRVSGTDRKNAGARYQRTAAKTTVSRMQQQPAEMPFASQPKRRLARIRPQDQERLRAAKIDLIAHFRSDEIDEQGILDQFIADCFEEWLATQRGKNGAGVARKGAK